MRLCLRMRKSAARNAANATIPPMTPPTIAPVFFDLWLFWRVELVEELAKMLSVVARYGGLDEGGKLLPSLVDGINDKADDMAVD